MKIIKEGKLPKSLVFFCDNCGTVFEADSDEYDNATNTMACPICGRKVRGTTSEYDDCEDDDCEYEKYLTSENFVFPEDADKVESGCASVSDEEIICIIKTGIDYLRNQDKESHWWWLQGDIWIDIIAVDDEHVYQVRVAKGYYDMPINYTRQDDGMRGL